MMAKRFGGKYSPGGDPVKPAAPEAPGSAHPFDGKRRSRAGFRSNLLFLMPFPFLLKAFGADPAGFALGLSAFAAMLLSAWLTRQGILAQEAYDARRVAKRPAIPRKIFGAVLMGLGIAGATLMSGGSLIYPLLFGAAAAALHLASFGTDPLRDKLAPDSESFQSDRVARAVEEGERHLTAMREAVARLGDHRLASRVDAFAATARTMLRQVEAAPADLTGARKYLGVYLMGARDATTKFADLYTQTREPALRGDYEALLGDLETRFAARHQALLSSSRADLDVEIEVLRERLHRDAPRPLPQDPLTQEGK